MRKLWDKFRRWLIRKLGGFDELTQPPVEQKPIEIHWKERTIVPISASVLIHKFEADCMSPDELEQMVKMQLADEIAHELVSSNAIYVFSTPDPQRCAVRFTGCVPVVL
jgi:hypothetical protein